MNDDHYCDYCDRLLSEEKGELAHGCLCCYGNAWVDKIDLLEKENTELKARLEKSISKHDHEIIVKHALSMGNDSKIGLEDISPQTFYTMKARIELRDKEIEQLKARLAHVESEVRPPESDMSYTELLLDEATRHQKTKDKLAHVESEYAKEREVTEFYGDIKNWGKINQHTINKMDLGDSDPIGSFCYRGVWVNNVEVAGKRARQRIKERKEFNAN